MKKSNNKTKYMKKFITNVFTYLLIHLFTFIPAYAFEDVIITNNSKLTDIRIENHDVIDVFPLITIMNDKNTLIVHPLKEGNSDFTVLTNNKKLVKFSVKVEAEKTAIEPVEGFEILPIDYPPDIYEFELDLPPMKATN